MSATDHRKLNKEWDAQRKHLPQPPPAIQERLNAHRRWIESRGKEGTRLVTTDDEMVDWRHLNFDRVDFREAKIEGLDCQDSSFRDADFRGALLTGIGFSRSDMRGACFDGSDVSLCRFIDAVIDRQQLSKATTSLIVWTRSEATEVARLMRDPH